jgi:hypothetical protein
MRKLILLAAIVLAVPGLALAAGKTGRPGKPQPPLANGTPKVVYVLKGTLEAYQPAGETSDGSVTVAVKSTNNQARTLRGQHVQIPVSAATELVGKVAVNDNVIVKVRASKQTTPAAVLAALLAAKAWQVIDQGPSKQRSPGRHEHPPTHRQ